MSENGFEEIEDAKKDNNLQALLLLAYTERMKFIEANKAKLIEAFIAETGLLPSEIVQCIQQAPDGGVRVWYRKKTDRELASLAEDLSKERDL